VKTIALRLRSPGTRTLAALACVVTISQSAASGAWSDRASRPQDLLGAQSCSSVSCHGQVEPQASATGPLGQAYHLWQAHDPHARAGLRLMQPRFQEVLQRASHRADGSADPLVAKQCAKCHDPFSILEGEAPAEPTVGHGIGCESCHGPARQWISKHYEQGVPRQELLELGMVDTKNVLVRARLCAECHVGSAENDVTHDMLAAGHPPLRFEMASHQALVTRKHWDDAPRRLAQPDHEVQLWAAGRIASTEAALDLLQRRAMRAATDATLMNSDAGRGAWPELAEYNCFACHRSLRAGVGTLPLEPTANRASGTLPWQRWNFECLPSSSADFDSAAQRLRAAMEKSLSPFPEDVARLAVEARAVLPGEIRCAPADALFATVSDRRGRFTWERACHEFAALSAMERSLRDHGLSSARPPQEKIARIGRSLSFTDNRFEWPAVFTVSPSEESQPADTMSLDEVSLELRTMAEQLHEKYRVLGTAY
jgi:hypothetical protein